MTTDVWKGVSAAGVSWSYDAEASVVSDDTPTLAQPSIPVYAARGFIPYSIEVGADYPGFADEMSKLLSQGFTDLLAVGTCTATGTAQPRGVFASATSNPTHTLVTTAGSIAGVDLRKHWAAVPERFRKNATHLVSTANDAVIRGLGNNLAMSDYSVNLLADGTSTLFGRPVVISDYAPTFTSTTGGLANQAILTGDFGTGFVVVQRAGMTVELVQHLFDTTTGRPTGQRGWFAYARHGYDYVNVNAFRVLANA